MCLFPCNKRSSTVLKVYVPKLLSLFAILVLGFGSIKRLNLALQATSGGDYTTHKKAIYDLVAGKNPYEWTLTSYANLENDPTNKGYAYFPGILYVNTFLYVFSVICTLILKLDFNWCSPFFLLHLPGILANLGVGIFLWWYLSKKDRLAALFAVTAWMFNFYLVLKNSLAGFDSVPILFLLLALYHLEEDDVLTGLFFALSVLFKTFAVITFPLFLFRSKKPLKFLTAGFITAFAFSLPFMTNFQDFWTYIQGALLVHGDRFVQGRPFLYYISYYYSVELFRIIPFGFYSLGSIFSGWILITANKLLQFVNNFCKEGKVKNLTGRLHIKNKFSIASLPFLSFYLLTPVLNRTYLLWGFPIFLIGVLRDSTLKSEDSPFKGVSKLLLRQLIDNPTKEDFDVLSPPRTVPFNNWKFYLVTVLYWISCYWYLAQWKDGFHIWHPI
ncbi:DUF2029 domain-containing protein [candidate division WWE3 bacterium]|nr:DUF2029 domain-containing protein [candidate division WWE3 bacterium]